MYMCMLYVYVWYIIMYRYIWTKSHIANAIMFCFRFRGCKCAKSSDVVTEWLTETEKSAVNWTESFSWRIARIVMTSHCRVAQVWRWWCLVSKMSAIAMCFGRCIHSKGSRLFAIVYDASKHLHRKRRETSSFRSLHATHHEAVSQPVICWCYSRSMNANIFSRHKFCIVLTSRLVYIYIY